MFNHGFSDEITIEEIVLKYIGVDIREKPLKKVLASMAVKYDERYKNLQPTYAQFSSPHLRVKFEYLIGRVIGLYELNEDDTSRVKKFFWDTASALRIVRQSKKPVNDYEIKKPNTEPIKKPVIETTIIPKSKPVVEKLKVTLYEYQDSDLNINSYAYFEKEDLIIDYWQLSANYEDEYFLTIKNEHLGMLYSKFEIENNNRALLLVKLVNTFSDDNCFEKVKSFLSLNNILFENNARHDEC
jgi:hypothetical protein